MTKNGEFGLHSLVFHLKIQRSGIKAINDKEKKETMMNSLDAMTNQQINN